MLVREAAPAILCSLLAGLGTSAAYAAPLNQAVCGRSRIEQTTAAGIVASAQSAGAAIGELRRLSGLTWEQLARMLGVSRRSLHFWASGKPMTPSHEERLHRVLSLLKRGDRGSAGANRAALFAGGENGVLPFDLVVAEDYTRAWSLLNEAGVARAPTPTSPTTAREKRTPRPPEELVGALQERVHPASGRLRAAKVITVVRRK